MTSEDFAALARKLTRKAFADGAHYQRIMNPTMPDIRAKAAGYGEAIEKQALSGLLEAVVRRLPNE